MGLILIRHNSNKHSNTVCTFVDPLCLVSGVNLALYQIIVGLIIVIAPKNIF